MLPRTRTPPAMGQEARHATRWATQERDASWGLRRCAVDAGADRSGVGRYDTARERPRGHARDAMDHATSQLD